MSTSVAQVYLRRSVQDALATITERFSVHQGAFVNALLVTLFKEHPDIIADVARMLSIASGEITNGDMQRFLRVAQGGGKNE